MAIGDKGYQMMQSGDIVLQSDFTRWLRDMWNWVKDTLGIKAKQGTRFEDMTLDDFTASAVKQLTSGRKIDASGDSTGSRHQADGAGNSSKDERLEKLRKQKPVVITGNEIPYSDNLKEYRRNANEYGLSIRGEYVNKDTGDKIGVLKNSIKEVTSHDLSVAQLQSVAAIPSLIENAIYIDTLKNEDTKRPDIKTFDYYVSGLKIGDKDYTVKMVVANDASGGKYYDQRLTNIEKGKLLSTGNAMQNHGEENNSPLSGVKDKRLISILQNNSANTDENLSGTRFQVAGKGSENTGSRYQILNSARIESDTNTPGRIDDYIETAIFAEYFSEKYLGVGRVDVINPYAELSPKFKELGINSELSLRYQEKVKQGTVAFFAPYIDNIVLLRNNGEEETAASIWHEASHRAIFELFGRGDRYNNAINGMYDILYPINKPLFDNVREVYEAYDEITKREECIVLMSELMMRNSTSSQLLDMIDTKENNLYSKIFKHIAYGKDTELGRDHFRSRLATGYGSLQEWKDKNNEMWNSYNAAVREKFSERNDGRGSGESNRQAVGGFEQELGSRFQVASTGNEKTLVGIHNISVGKLTKALKNGGFANPFAAVVDLSKDTHTGYGEISLILPSDMIAKKKALEYLRIPAPIAGAQDNQELSNAGEELSKQRYNSAEVRKTFNYVAKVIQDFENLIAAEDKSKDTRFQTVLDGVADLYESR
jgi:hypothetical protein